MGTLPSGQAPVSQPAPTITVGDEQIAPQWPVPGIVPAPAGSILIAPKRSSGGGLVILILALVLITCVLYVGLPEFLKRSYPAAAARDGITLTVDSVEVSWKRVRLVGLTATMADLPGFTAHVKSLEIWVAANLDPTQAAVHEVTLTIDGTWSSVADSLKRVRIAHDFSSLREGTLRELSVDAGHLVWSRALGEGTKIEAENLVLDAEKNGHDPLGDDFTFATPLLGVAASRGKLGSWAVKGQVEHGAMKATLTLDPSGASKAAATFAYDGTSVTAFDLLIPRSSISLLGIAPALAGRRPDDPFFVEGEAHYAQKSASHVESTVRLNLSGARFAGALAPTDAQLEAHADGDPARPIEVQRGVFGIGPFRGTVAGPVTFGDGFVRGELTFRTGGARCPSGPDVAMAGGVAFDTRTFGDAKLTVAPTGRCALRILPP
jgi:hypothetical protein